MEGERASSLQPPKEPHATGLSVVVSPDKPVLDIVFVHGFTGHPERTWTHKGEVNTDRNVHDNDSERPPKIRKLLPSSSLQHRGSGARKAVYWPRDLVPIAIPDARVLTYGYDTHIRHRLGPAMSKNTIYDIAWDFLVSLEAERYSEPSRPLLFIAHSLGGIVVKEALRRSRGCDLHQSHFRSIFESTAAIFFFGTPHGGADPRGLIQHIAEKIIRIMGFSVNEQIVNTLLPSSERLRELREEFGPMAREKNWIIYSFQEQYGVTALSGNKVVDDPASCLNDLGIEVTQHIASNHMDMCRFSGPCDIEYRKVVGALNRVLRFTAESAPLAMRSVLTADQRRSYLDSLRFDQIDARHATIKTAHVKTCKWLLSKSEYQDWLEVDKTPEHHGFLWIKGKPATGKSTIMKFAYANAKKTMTDTIIISFFFNARGEHLEKTTFGMYRSLLSQLLEKVPELQYLLDFLGLTAPNPSDSHGWNIETVKDIFSCAIKNLGNRCLTCFIDALDECEEDDVREMVGFFENLGQLAVSSRIRFHVCFSSRHYPYITIEKSVQLILEGQDGHQQDISNYLHSELKAGRSQQVEQIKAEVLERASGIFLWVVLVVKMLNKEYDRGRVHALRKRLDEIPNGLDELFKDILTRDSQNVEELILSLQWILYAKRPLKREELYFAVLAGANPEALTAWNPEEITEQDMERFVLSSSKGLAEITKSKDHTVQFIHESVRDFLRGDGLNRLRYDLQSNFPGLSHEMLKQSCQTYMRIDTSELLQLGTSLPAASSQEAAILRRQASEKFPFLEYAVCNVLYHADAADGCGISQETFVKNFCVEGWVFLNNLFERYQVRRYTSAGSLLYILAEKDLPSLIRIELGRVSHMDTNGGRYCFPLLAALVHKNENAVRAFLVPGTDAWSDCDILCIPPPSSAGEAHQEAVRRLLKHRPDITSMKDRTVLSWAAERGDIDLVKVLLATGKVDSNSRRKDGRYPLLMAASGGHEAVVKLLLARSDVEADSKDKSGMSPLWMAVSGGHDAVIKLLLARSDVEADSKDSSGRSPLSWAASRGCEAVVKLLLARSDVEADSKDNSGRSPLSFAVSGGQEAVVKLLLARSDVEADSKDSSGQSPLWIAASGGHEAVVELLLARSDVEADSKDKDGLSPLSVAASGGHEAVVKLLLARSDVEADSKDNSGRSPLSFAVSGGNEAVVELLLARSDVEADSRNSSGRSPLSWAVSRGCEAVVKLLLARSDVEADSRNSSGRSPLSWAASGGNEAVVELLLARSDVEADSRNNSGRSPLSFAAFRGNEAVVELLLARSDVEADSKDASGRSPLSWAAYGWRDLLAKLLLTPSDVEADSKDNSGRSPLSFAVSGGQEAVVKLLLARSDVEADSKDSSGQSPLWIAASGGHEAVVELLLARSDVEADSKDKDGLSPLSVAASGGHEAVVKLLLARSDVEADSKDNSGRSPLSFAAVIGREAVVKLLLARSDVEADSKDNSGRSPLSFAAFGGREAVVKLLLARSDVETDSKDDSGQSPLSFAASEGHNAVVKLLVARSHVEADSKDKRG